MDTNDFLGSFAQENVIFDTQVVKTTTVGDNFWKAMIFVESDRFVDAATTDWIAVPGLPADSGIKACTVTAQTYASVASGLLQSWLYDLFANGFTGDCILVACGAKADEGAPNTTFIENMTTAYDTLKAYAYHKTVCAGGDSTIASDIAVALAKLCSGDRGLLSGAPYYPYSTSTPSVSSSDTLYTAIKSSGYDAFFSAHQDVTRNASLYSLGLAMSVLNGSGTCVGNSFDMVKSSAITSSGASGGSLSISEKSYLSGLNVQYFKPIGDNTGMVAALGAKTINGDVIQATWIIAYITYMSKISIAQILTEMNFLKNNTSYLRFINIMSSYIRLFGDNGSGRLKSINISAPPFSALPTAREDQIIVPNAWTATYVDQVREVQITGTLYIGV